MTDSQNESLTDHHDGRRWATWLADAASDVADEWSQPLTERHDDGAIHLLDLVAAVDYLGRGHSAGLTIWDALEEALRWWVADQELVRHGAPEPDAEQDDHPTGVDPLNDTLSRFLATLPEPDAPPAADALQEAIRRWTAAMAERHNASYHWPHPTPRRRFPPENLLV